MQPSPTVPEHLAHVVTQPVRLPGRGPVVQLLLIECPVQRQTVSGSLIVLLVEADVVPPSESEVNIDTWPWIKRIFNTAGTKGKGLTCVGAFSKYNENDVHGSQNRHIDT